MRITNSMMMGNYLSDLSGNLNRLSKYLKQQTTGKSINRISDDPVGVTKSLLARNRLTSTARYQENVKTADTWLRETDSATAALNEIIQKAYERSVTASNGSLTDDNLKAIAEDIAQLKDELLSTANAKIGDSYLFAGYSTTNRPESGMPFAVDEKGHLYYNGINMSNEGFAETISTSQEKLDTSVAEAGKALTAANGSSNANGALANLKEAVNHTKKAFEAGRAAASKGQEIANSKDHSGSDMSNHLRALAENIDSTINDKPDGAGGITEGKASLAAKAEGLINTAQAAAEAEEKAYTAWQESLGTAAEAEAKQAYEDAKAAATDALDTAKLATDAAVAGAGEALTATKALDDAVKGAGELATAISKFSENSDPADAEAARDAAAKLMDTMGGALAFPDLDSRITQLNTAITTGTPTIETAMADLKTQLEADISGYDTMTKASRALDKEETKSIALQVSNAEPMAISATGSELLGRGNDNIFAILDNLHKAMLGDGDQDEIRQSLDKLQASQSKILSLAAKNGAKIQRLDTLSQRYEENIVNYTQMRSDAEDVDLAEAIMNFSSAQSVYNAALAAGSKVIQTSLIDFLR